MRMFSAGAGLGAGIRSYRVIFVFETRKALDRFLESGWDSSGHEDAAAKTKSGGGAYSGAVSVAPHQKGPRAATHPPGHQVLQG